MSKKKTSKSENYVVRDWTGAVVAVFDRAEEDNLKAAEAHATRLLAAGQKVAEVHPA